MLAENTYLAEGGDRVKFKAIRKGCISDFLSEHNACHDVFKMSVAEMVQALGDLESYGAAPVLADGKVAGNAAMRMSVDDVDVIIVSKSGKTAGHPIDSDMDFCIVSHFNTSTWTAEYYSRNPFALPTSDTPLHCSALRAGYVCQWHEHPLVSLHGHAVQTEQEAARLHLPCSTVETMFSTPQDAKELLSLMQQHPFPQNKIYVRKGHGFIILDSTMEHALNLFQQKIVPFI